MRLKKQSSSLMRNKEIDAILHKMAMLYQNLGLESTPEQRLYAKEEERRYLGMIAKIDAEYASRLMYG